MKINSDCKKNFANWLFVIPKSSFLSSNSPILAKKIVAHFLNCQASKKSYTIDSNKELSYLYRPSWMKTRSWSSVGKKVGAAES